MLLATVALLVLGLSPSARASDHADPTNLMGPESNITGLFLFPKDDRLILIFNVRRALTVPAPYSLEPYLYEIKLDLSTPVDFTDPANTARYGGTVSEPAKLHADATIRIRLNNDASLKSVEYEGLENTGDIRSFFGVRDDPFTFPRFFGVNVVSMALSLPRNAFPDGQQDFILWGTTSRDGEQIDHVGRSIRTQLPRFGFLNTIAPDRQVPALVEHSARTTKIYNFLKGNKEWWSAAFGELMETTFLLRKYDNQPDVMIYSDRFAPGYPNGRQLGDDVVAQTCAFGDCLLQDIAFIEGGFPRSTVNDKPFLPDFPYLAEPWPDKAPPAPPTRSLTPYLVVIAIIFILLSWVLVEVLHVLVRNIWRRVRQHGHRAAT
ncbi:hypothetical protein [Rhizobium halophytocola]|uniref:DUF4331 domain-containing protein n=1 Tax=Rhizobium halophytocola TaxID=735519 RepID=A0ABS4E0V2_9HYPH|nr:hypothetical protein [Rhizobium halophytocola]MBP1851561.1 hypothetical protein [Rhizobium halophytocola]